MTACPVASKSTKSTNEVNLMSIALTQHAWTLPIKSTRKIVLLSLCDNANDNGSCCLSISEIAKKCSLDNRVIYDCLIDLETNGFLKRSIKRGKKTDYLITLNQPLHNMHPCTICTPAQYAPMHNTEGSEKVVIHSAPPVTEGKIPIKSTSCNEFSAASDPPEIGGVASPDFLRGGVGGGLRALAVGRKSNNIYPKKEPTNTHIAPYKHKEKEIINDNEATEDIMIELPKWLSRESWDSIIDHRKSIKAPMTDHAEKLMLKKLTQIMLDGNDISEVIDNMILNNWKAPYPIKTIKNNKVKFDPVEYVRSLRVNRANENVIDITDVKRVA